MLSRFVALVCGFALIFDEAAAAPRHCQGSALVQGPCIGIRGTLRWWHGWPPFLRIESDGTVYGIWPPEHENVPKIIKDLAPYSTRGVYLLCPLDKVATVPYYDRSIELYCIEKATIDEREARVNRRLVWTRLQRPLVSYN